MNLSQEALSRIKFEIFLSFTAEFFCGLASFMDLIYDKDLFMAGVWLFLALLNVCLGWTCCQRIINDDIGRRNL